MEIQRHVDDFVRELRLQEYAYPTIKAYRSAVLCFLTAHATVAHPSRFWIAVYDRVVNKFYKTKMDLIRPQVEIVCATGDRYVADFAIEMNGAKLAIELDGHEFHEKTKEQAEYDKKRDRDITAEGWTIIHFTGREVWRSPMFVYDEIESLWLKLLNSRITEGGNGKTT